MSQAGDKPGHPFRGNQYTYTDRATSDLSIGAGLIRGGPKSKDVIAAYNAAQDAIAPDLNHLAKENAIPAKIADVPEGGGGEFADKGIPSSQGWNSMTAPEFRPGAPGITEREADRITRVTERSIRRARANEGMGGTPTPKEGDRVKISDRVVGGGKTGVVVSSHGSFHIVATTKKDIEEGRGHSYHSSDLQTKSGAKAPRVNRAEKLLERMAKVEKQQGTNPADQGRSGHTRMVGEPGPVKVTSGSVKERTSEGRTAAQWAKDEARDDADTDEYYERTHRFSEEHGG